MRPGGEVIDVHEVLVIGVRNYRLIPPGVTLPTWGRNVASGGRIIFSMVDYEGIFDIIGRQPRSNKVNI